MVSTEAHTEETPRYFWRRLFAYAVDVLIAWLVAVSVLAILADDDLNNDMVTATTSYTFGFRLDSDAFKPPLYVGTKTCGQPKVGLALLQDYVAPASISSAEFCVERSFGLPVAAFATVRLADTPEAGDLGGKEIEIPMRFLSLHGFGDVIAFLVFLCLGIITTRLSGRSPGKWLLGLRVVGRNPVPSLRRELVRNLPHLLVIPTLALINWLLLSHPVVPPSAQTLATGLQTLAIAAFIFLWLVPMVRWRGALPHDRWFGTKVVRTDGNRTGGHGDSGSPRQTDLPSDNYTGLAPTMVGRP